MLHTGSVNEKSEGDYPRDCPEARLVVETAHSGSECAGEESKRRARQHIDPKQGGSLLFRHIGSLNGCSGQPKIAE